MRLQDTGYTKEELKEIVHKYMIDTYERFDFIAETAKDMEVTTTDGDVYLDFYAGIAVNSAGSRFDSYLQLSIHDSSGIIGKANL